MSTPITPLAHQKEGLDEIIARAKAYFAGIWKNLSIRPRWHSLVDSHARGWTILTYLRTCMMTSSKTLNP
jgi:hypothetical protein